MQKKKEREGSARLGRAAKDTYQYSEGTLSKSASLLWDQPLLGLPPTSAVVFFSDFFLVFRIWALILGLTSDVSLRREMQNRPPFLSSSP